LRKKKEEKGVLSTKKRGKKRGGGGKPEKRRRSLFRGGGLGPCHKGKERRKKSLKSWGTKGKVLARWEKGKKKKKKNEREDPYKGKKRFVLENKGGGETQLLEGQKRKKTKEAKRVSQLGS